jgi:hypothetical protein
VARDHPTDRGLIHVRVRGDPTLRDTALDRLAHKGFVLRGPGVHLFGGQLDLA